MYIYTFVLLLLIHRTQSYNQNKNIIIKNIFENVNKDVKKFNAIAAEIAWEASVNPNNPALPSEAAEYQKERITWEHNTCDMLATLRKNHLLNDTQAKQTRLMCRGPIYTFKETRQSSDLLAEIQSLNTDAKICIPIDKEVDTSNLSQLENAVLEYVTNYKEEIVVEEEADGKFENKLCMKEEPDLAKLMSFSKNVKVLKWIWSVWREKVGVPMKEPYMKLIDIENTAARRNGYSDIGAFWREELEISNLRQLCRRLYNNVKPLYTLLHGVVRYFLRLRYGDVIPQYGPIPAHLLGNLWSQNWEKLVDLIEPNSVNIDESIGRANWTVLDMVNRAEDFYQSLGLPSMTNKFWQKSIFIGKPDKDTRCHGTAADMYTDGDFRLIYCSGKTAQDFYVIHHEMGHIQYYMAYDHQPAIFRQGANSAFHESIGDSIMYGVLTPQHLHRLGIVNDSYLYTNDSDTEDLYESDTEDSNSQIVNTVELSTKNGVDLIKIDFNNINYNKEGSNEGDFQTISKKFEEKQLKLTTNDVHLLKIALNKIPEIPLSLLIDEYRWKLYEGSIDKNELNKEFWKMTLELQGIAPPNGKRGEEYFDIGAIYHVSDNTPYIRYYLASFLQLQIFETLCKASVYGKHGLNRKLPKGMPLHRCDIYGSKSAGNILKSIMSKGKSEHWRQILNTSIGADDITTSSFNMYYKPLKKLLKKIVKTYNIPLGW